MGIDTISYDISNSHDSVDRHPARLAFEKYFPHYLPFFDATYGKRIELPM
jgi:hypothetical protein